jgi:hypothetical protein
MKKTSSSHSSYSTVAIALLATALIVLSFELRNEPVREAGQALQVFKKHRQPENYIAKTHSESFFAASPSKKAQANEDEVFQNTFSKLVQECKASIRTDEKCFDNFVMSNRFSLSALEKASFDAFSHEENSANADSRELLVKLLSSSGKYPNLASKFAREELAVQLEGSHNDLSPAALDMLAVIFKNSDAETAIDVAVQSLASRVSGAATFDPLYDSFSKTHPDFKGALLTALEGENIISVSYDEGTTQNTMQE